MSFGDRSIIHVVVALLFSQSSIALSAEQVKWTVEQQEIINIVKAWPFGLHEDFDAWVAGYHPHWTYWELGTDNLRLRSEHMTRVRNYIGSGAQVLEFEIDPKHVDIRGDMAVIRYNAVETIREASEETILVRFSSANIFLKQEGAWKLFSTNIHYLADP